MASNSMSVTMSSISVFFVFTMRIKQWRRCNIFISADNHWIICILWHYNILSFYDYNFRINKKTRGLNQMGRNAPWDLSYSNNCLEASNFHYQILYHKTIFSFSQTNLDNNKPLEKMFWLMIMFIKQYIMFNI